VFAALHAPRRIAKTRQSREETDDGDCVVAQLGSYCR
jgi:FPC/CPF motif-containing protein YcgG